MNYLSTAEDGGLGYLSTDPNAPSGGASDAVDVAYDPTASGLTADDVQAALDEIAAAGTDDAAVQALIDAAISDLLAGAPGALNTLNELAAALGDDANFATTVTAALAAKMANPMTTAGDLIYEGGGVDQALGTALSQSSAGGGNPGAAAAVDGSDATFYHPANGDNAAWISFDLGAAKIIGSYRLKQSSGQLTQIQTSADGSTGWTTVATAVAVADTGVVAFGPVTARFWRVLLVGFYDIYTISLFDSVVPSRLPKGTLADLITQGATHPEWVARSAVLPVYSGCKVYMNGTQAIAVGADRVVTFDSEDWDTDSYHESVTNPGRVKAPVAGHYYLTAHLYGLSVLGDWRFRINGTTLMTDVYPNPTAGGALTFSAELLLAANDYVEVVGMSNNVTIGHASAREGQNDLSIFLIGGKAA